MLSPVILGLSEASHAYVAVAVLVNGILNVPPLQIVAVFAFVIAGTGFIVTVTVCAAPTQPPEEAVGVTVYVTV